MGTPGGSSNGADLAKFSLNFHDKNEIDALVENLASQRCSVLGRVMTLHRAKAHVDKVLPSFRASSFPPELIPCLMQLTIDRWFSDRSYYAEGQVLGFMSWGVNWYVHRLPITALTALIRLLSSVPTRTETTTRAPPLGTSS